MQTEKEQVEQLLIARGVDPQMIIGDIDEIVNLLYAYRRVSAGLPLAPMPY